MTNVFLYVTDTMADWEIGHITVELNTRRYFRKDAPEIAFRTIGLTTEPVRTMGGLTVIPDCDIFSADISDGDVLILPGADTWSDPKHTPILDIAERLLNNNGTVSAICGATVALAFRGILDRYEHTSNGPGFLEMFCPVYNGKEKYHDVPALTDRGLITAGTTGGLQMAAEIIRKLDVFRPETLSAWTGFFSTGGMNEFYALMQSLQS